MSETKNSTHAIERCHKRHSICKNSWNINISRNDRMRFTWKQHQLIIEKNNFQNSFNELLMWWKLRKQTYMKSIDSPHILRGASSSSRIGWLRNISLDLRHKPLTSASANWTVFPGRQPRTIIAIKIIIMRKNYNTFLKLFHSFDNTFK